MSEKFDDGGLVFPIVGTSEHHVADYGMSLHTFAACMCFAMDRGINGPETAADEACDADDALIAELRRRGAL